MYGVLLCFIYFIQFANFSSELNITGLQRQIVWQLCFCSLSFGIKVCFVHILTAGRPGGPNRAQTSRVCNALLHLFMLNKCNSDNKWQQIKAGKLFESLMFLNIFCNIVCCFAKRHYFLFAQPHPLPRKSQNNSNIMCRKLGFSSSFKDFWVFRDIMRVCHPPPNLQNKPLKF